MDVNTFRDGIFSLRTRRFGSVAECMIKRIKNLDKAKSLFHDLYDNTSNHKIEVKFSVVLKKSECTVNENTVLKCIEDAVAENRAVKFADWSNEKFTCNIQQVKRTEFDVLYYGLFFADEIKMFKVMSGDVKTNEEGGWMNYSDKQHKGNLGEGQFHITEKTLDRHLTTTLFNTISYEQLYELLK
jgi:hypothetical protein